MLTLDITNENIVLEIPTVPGLSLSFPTALYGSSFYTVRIDQPDANTIYRGEASVGSATSALVWRIQKITISGTTVTALWADGNTNFDNRWNDRLTLTYS